MKLGPNQKEWLAYLRANGDQQVISELGDVELNIYCCLGALCNIEIKKLESDVLNCNDALGVVIRSDGSLRSIVETEYGLKEDMYLPTKLKDLYKFHGVNGTFNEPISVLNTWDYNEQQRITHEIEPTLYRTLADLNDDNCPWSIIADIIEDDPSNVFTEPY